MNRSQRGTKGRIVAGAWKLFYEQGYANTTVEDILRESATSKGTFYHYFAGKDALLGTLSLLFDEKYASLSQTLPPELDAFGVLMYFNRELFAMIENSISLELLTRLYSSQLITEGAKHLLDHNRVYYRLLRQTVLRGQAAGELRGDLGASDIVKAYALCERALLYDWCLLGGSYPLGAYAAIMMPNLLGYLRPVQKENRAVQPDSAVSYRL